MNEDESTYEVPDYILSRLQPTLSLGFPGRDDEMAILKYHLPFAEAELLALTVEFLQEAHKLKLDFSPRDGINILRFAIKRMAQDPAHPMGRDAAWREALHCVLGEEAYDLRNLARRRAKPSVGSMPRSAWVICFSIPTIRCTPTPKTKMRTTSTESQTH